MKAKETVTMSAALAAVAMALWNRHRHVKCAREAEFEEKCNEEALSTFEGEGGLVLA
jgi:hypothetical protein